MNIEFKAVVIEDSARNYGPEEIFFPVGGGALRPNGVAPDADFDVRILNLRPVGPPEGDLTSIQWMFPGGIVLIGSSGQTVSLSGKKITITITETPAE